MKGGATKNGIIVIKPSTTITNKGLPPASLKPIVKVTTKTTVVSHKSESKPIVTYPKSSSVNSKKDGEKVVTRPVAKVEVATTKTLSITTDKPKVIVPLIKPKPIISPPIIVVDDNTCGKETSNWNGEGIVSAVGAGWVDLEGGLRVNFGKCSKLTYKSKQTVFKVKDRVTYSGYRSGTGKSGWAKAVICK